MVDFGDELRKIKELSNEYGKKIDVEKQDLIATKKQDEATAKAVKAKIKDLEKSLTNQMPFQVNYQIGESTGVKKFPFKSRVYLVKTNENKINMRMEAGGNASDDSYTNADPDILIMITDDKLNAFLNAIQEELKKRLSK
jgi:hypothetical protein